MKRKILFSSLVLLIFGSIFYSFGFKDAGAAPLSAGKTLVLYDAVSGTIPASPLMGFTAFPPDAVSLTYSDGVTILDTALAGGDAYAGWVSNAVTISEFPVLDRTAGIQVNFTLQLESETHVNNNRAGFSVILLDKDTRGIELAFWQNEIWTQNDDTSGGLFTHGEGVAFNTVGLTDYQVTFIADTYTLSANAVPILSGPVRDYSRFEGFLDPYETPNFLFFGDDTTSAQARIRLRFVSVTGSEPVASAITTTSTDLRQPTASFTPLPSASPIPSSTPSAGGRIFELCPFGWLIAFMMIGNIFLIRKLRLR